VENGARILVVEDNEIERRGICQFLRMRGYTVFAADGVDKALGFLGEKIDVMLCDVALGAEVGGLELLNLWKKQRSESQFIIITGQSRLCDAVAAIKAGAFDYLAKPVALEAVSALIERAMKANGHEAPEQAEARNGREYGMGLIVGQSTAMKNIFARIERAAQSDSTVLILGENGTGKDMVAQALHRNSRRRKGPFVAVNVAAVPATLVESELFGHIRGAFTGATDKRLGRFEQADGGSLFIDEIGDFELSLQPKLLRALETLTVTPVGGHEEKRVDVRVIAATSRNIGQMVREGKFREDLYYRLNVVQIAIPPLRQRPEDIAFLVEHFMQRMEGKRNGPARKLSPDLMRRLLAYQWPGNVRELRNTLESMIVLAETDMLSEGDLPEYIAAEGNAAGPDDGGESNATMDAIEHRAIVKALAETRGNRTHAAQILGISLRTLQRKIRVYALDDSEKEANGDGKKT
jgi:DNA-binding NtrC family response regulator